MLFSTVRISWLKNPLSAQRKCNEGTERQSLCAFIIGFI